MYQSCVLRLSDKKRITRPASHFADSSQILATLGTRRGGVTESRRSRKQQCRLLKSRMVRCMAHQSIQNSDRWSRLWSRVVLQSRDASHEDEDTEAKAKMAKLLCHSYAFEQGMLVDGKEGCSRSVRYGGNFEEAESPRFAPINRAEQKKDDTSVKSSHHHHHITGCSTMFINTTPNQSTSLSTTSFLLAH